MLVNILDTSKTEDDGALYLAFNHESPIHHAGFLPTSPLGEEVYALSDDHHLSIYQLTNPESQGTDTPPTVFGNLRKALGDDDLYVIDVVRTEQGPAVAVGNTKLVYHDRKTEEHY
jgi:WD repeat-containing protein 89